MQETNNMQGKIEVQKCRLGGGIKAEIPLKNNKETALRSGIAKMESFIARFLIRMEEKSELRVISRK